MSDNICRQAETRYRWTMEPVVLNDSIRIMDCRIRWDKESHRASSDFNRVGFQRFDTRKFIDECQAGDGQSVDKNRKEDKPDYHWPNGGDKIILFRVSIADSRKQLSSEF